MGGRRYETAIVGAGIAGAATAWHLARLGVGPLLLLERDAQPGGHSTARNAAILRTAIPDPRLHALARESFAFYREPPPGFAGVPLVDPVGLVLAAPAAHADALRAWALDPACSEGGRALAPEELHARVPALAQGVEAAFLFEREGVLDVDAILQGFLRGARAAGVELRTGCTVQGLLRGADGALRGLATDQGEVEARRVVLAGGGWAAEPAAANGLDLPLRPHRRHLLVTQPDAAVDPRAPVVWLQGEDFYFRPESGGMLMSACDHVAVPPSEGEHAQPEVLEDIAAKSARWLPGLADAGAAHFWAGMRTFAAGDERFVIGADPRLAGLHWLAALGGHGVTCGHAAGRLCAEAVAGVAPAPAEFSPARLLSPVA